MKRKISKYFIDAGIRISDNAANKLAAYYDLLIEANSSFNLTSITEQDEVIIKHFLDSALLLSADRDLDGKSLCDVGTGAGFPGLVLAICVPKLNVTLIESVGKKCTFLSDVVQKLSLDNVEIFNLRAEEAGREPDLRESFDYGVSRAVARINILLEYLLPLVKVEGEAIFYKGTGFKEEMNEAENARSILNGAEFDAVEFNLPNNMGERALVFCKKITETSDKYPRRPGIPTKRPL